MRRVAGALLLFAACQGAWPTEAASPPGGTPSFGAGLGFTYAWGWNKRGQLGDGSQVDRHVPEFLANGFAPDLGSVKSRFTLHSVAAGNQHSLFLVASGRVLASGFNAGGQLGDGTHKNRLQPVQVSGLDDVIAIAAGSDHSLALRSDGTVWAWGHNNHGQLGDGTHVNRAKPVPVSGLSRIIAIAAGIGGPHSLALRDDGTVWAWGENDHGQLGDGTTTDRPHPVEVKGPSGSGILNRVTAIAGGGAHSLARRSDGTVWAWGDNAGGQLGDGTVVDRPTPVQVLASGPGNTPLTGVAAIAAGSGHSLALRADGTVRAWGINGFGQLGDNTTTSRTRAVAVRSSAAAPPDSLLQDVVVIAAGAAHSLAVRSTGQVAAWGLNSRGQLGDGSTLDRHGPTNALLIDVFAVAGGAFHTVAGVVSTRLRTWGKNAEAQLGNGSVGGVQNYPGDVAPLGADHVLHPLGIAGGHRHSLAVGTLLSITPHGGAAWGANDRHQVGAGTAVTPLPAAREVLIDALPPVVGLMAVAAGSNHSLGLADDGRVIGWGANDLGQLGAGVLGDIDPGVEVAGPGGDGVLTDVVAIAAGSAHSLALRADGTVWAWGDNEAGQLGDGTASVTPRVVPAPVLAPGVRAPLSRIKAIAAGQSFSLALRDDGVVLAWGLNDRGQLGDGTTTPRFLPVPTAPVGGRGGIFRAKAIAGGWEHVLSLRADGTVWAWGANDTGQLGDDTLTDHPVPTRVANRKGSTGPIPLRGVKAVAGGASHSLALLASFGVPLGWGLNTSGQIAQPDPVVFLPDDVRPNPDDNFFVNVIAIAAGSQHSLALFDGIGKINDPGP